MLLSEESFAGIDGLSAQEMGEFMLNEKAQTFVHELLGRIDKGGRQAGRVLLLLSLCLRVHAYLT